MFVCMHICMQCYQCIHIACEYVNSPLSVGRARLAYWATTEGSRAACPVAFLRMSAMLRLVEGRAASCTGAKAAAPATRMAATVKRVVGYVFIYWVVRRRKISEE